MTEVITRPSYRDLDGNFAFGLLRPLTLEMGIRDRRWITSADRPELGKWIECKIGMAASTCDLTVRLSEWDLFDVTISKTRRTKAGRVTTVLVQMLDVYNEDLTKRLLSAWMQLCNEKGW